MSSTAMSIQPLPGLSLRNLGLLSAGNGMNKSDKKGQETKGTACNKSNQLFLPEMK